MSSQIYLKQHRVGFVRAIRFPCDPLFYHRSLLTRGSSQSLHAGSYLNNLAASSNIRVQRIVQRTAYTSPPNSCRGHGGTYATHSRQ